MTDQETIQTAEVYPPYSFLRAGSIVIAILLIFNLVATIGVAIYQPECVSAIKEIGQDE